MKLRPSPLVLDGPEPGDGAANGVRASGAGVTFTDLNDPALLEMLRGGVGTASGASVTLEGAMRVAVAYRCTHLIAGVCGNLPIDVMIRVGEGERQPAKDSPLRKVLTVSPNGWQTPAEFRKMLTAHAVLRGNGYALKITSMGRILALWPMHPDRVEVTQGDDMALVYTYTRKNGSRLTLQAADVLHLRGLTLDGVKGLGVITHAREALGLSMQTEKAGARLFSKGVLAGGALKSPNALSPEAYDRLKQSIDEHNAGAENAHKMLILEEGLDLSPGILTADDAQFLETRQFERSDVGMFFGVPPHMYGDVSGSTSWGTGIEQQTIGFQTFTAEDWFTMWEQSLERDCLTPAERAKGVYVRINRNALVRGDIKTRWAAYVAGRQWGVLSADEVRAMEDMNPRPDGEGGEYCEPPNTAGAAGGAQDLLADDPADKPPSAPPPKPKK